jgi:hypothetical protein
VVVPPGDTEKVSTSKTAATVALPDPLPLTWMSVWYQKTPNGAVGMDRRVTRLRVVDVG